jgi:hypothetical protein
MFHLGTIIDTAICCLMLGFAIGFVLGDKSGYWFGKMEAETDAAMDRIEAKLKEKSK